MTDHVHKYRCRFGVIKCIHPGCDKQLWDQETEDMLNRYSQLEIENERLRRYLTTREIEERMELDDLVNRLKGENNRLREGIALYVSICEMSSDMISINGQHLLALLERKEQNDGA